VVPCYDLFRSDQEKLDKAPPTSFHVIQVDAKPPCLILKAVFLRGTPGKQRKEVSSLNVCVCVCEREREYCFYSHNDDIITILPGLDCGWSTVEITATAAVRVTQLMQPFTHFPLLLFQLCSRCTRTVLISDKLSFSTRLLYRRPL